MAVSRFVLGSSAVLVLWLAPVVASAAVVFAPHRAVYDLSLSQVRSGSNVSDVRGQMMFQWDDACDGWTSEQRYRMDFLYNQGQEVETASSYTTWESKDGREFSFNSRSAANGVVEEEIRGTAEREAGEVSYRAPQDLVQPLPGEAMFPTAHSQSLIENAQRGKTLFQALVFDGSEFKDLTRLSAVVGSVRKSEVPVEPAAGIDASLLDSPLWPITMAAFSESSDAAEPLYEVVLNLLENGIVAGMEIDYGDFAMSARLIRLERLSPAVCR